MHFFALSVTTSLKIPGTVILRRVFTRPGPKADLAQCPLSGRFRRQSRHGLSGLERGFRNVPCPPQKKAPTVKPGQGCAGCRRRRACPAPARPSRPATTAPIWAGRPVPVREDGSARRPMPAAKDIPLVAGTTALGHCKDMPPFIYRCLSTGQRVWDLLPKMSPKISTPISRLACPVCRQIHHVNPATGVVLGEKAK